jgi:hypothetical protein
MKPWRTMADVLEMEKRGIDFDIDLQPESERIEREQQANAESLKFAQEIRQARTDGSKCFQKACIFPAVLNGECRQHAQDRRAELSLLPSIMTSDSAKIRLRSAAHKGAQ